MPAYPPLERSHCIQYRRAIRCGGHISGAVFMSQKHFGWRALQRCQLTVALPLLLMAAMSCPTFAQVATPSAPAAGAAPATDARSFGPPAMQRFVLTPVSPEEHDREIRARPRNPNLTPERSTAPLEPKQDVEKLRDRRGVTP